MVISDEEFQLVEKRLEAWNEKLSVACIELGPLTKDEMLKHVKAKDVEGEKISEVFLHYLRKLKERK